MYKYAQYLGAEEFTLTDQFFSFVKFDSVPQTHASGAEETWQNNKKNKKSQKQVLLLA
jgi:hypothetical protein